jgi:hypothetical protein
MTDDKGTKSSQIEAGAAEVAQVIQNAASMSDVVVSTAAAAALIVQTRRDKDDRDR